MDLIGKRLLILAGAPVHAKIVAAARRMGVYTIVTDNIPNSPAKSIADESWDISTTDIDMLVSRCRESRVDGVLNLFIQTAQKPYQELCEKLRLPCYGSADQFQIMNNKRLFKDLCKRFNVDVIPEYDISDVQKGNVDYPLLVKPADGRGSRGQTVCNCRADVDCAIERAKIESEGGEYLIEKYMTNCRDMSLAYIVVKGEPYLLKIGDRFLGDKKDGLDRQHMASILPSENVDDYLQTVHLNVCNMIKALGMRFGPVFLQGFWSHGKMFMYDPALRFPGSDFDLSLKLATGFDVVSSCVRYALTGDCTCCCGNPNEAFRYAGGCCVIVSVAVRAGVIGAIEGFEQIRGDFRVTSAVLNKGVGDKIEQTGDVRQRAAEFVGYVKNKEDAVDFYKYIVKTLRILDESGKDMVISRIDFNDAFCYNKINK